MKFEYVGRNLSGGTVAGMHACTACPHGCTCKLGSTHTVTRQHILGIGRHLRSGPSWCHSVMVECWGCVGVMQVNSMTKQTVAHVRRIVSMIDAGRATPHPEGAAAILCRNEKKGRGDIQK